jgi:ABC-2 type transport system permease protein
MAVRDKGTYVANLILPIGLFVLFTALNTGAGGVAGVAAWLMAGVMVQSIMTSGLETDMTWLANTRERGILLRVRATPLPPGMLVAAYTLVRLLMVMFQTALIVVVGLLVFGVRINEGAILPAIGMVLLGGIVFLALGQAIASAAPTAGAASAIANLIFFPLLFLSNIWISTENLPAVVQNIIRWNPAYMLVDLLRPTLVALPATQAAWINLIGLMCYGTIAMVLAARFFRWEPKR